MEKNKLERMNLSKYLKTKYKDVKDVDPADVDDVATAKDIASADKNIMIQLKKQIGLVKLQAGKKHMRTSIGKSVNTSPKNKDKKRK